MSSISESLLKGAQEALAYAQGTLRTGLVHKVTIPNKIDVLAIRNNLHMSRKAFSDEFGFSLRTLEKWERGERTPEGPTRAYLLVIANNPEAVKRALHRAQ